MIAGVIAFLKSFKGLPLSVRFDTRTVAQRAEVSFEIDRPRTVMMAIHFSVSPRSKHTHEDLARALGLSDPDAAGARKEKGAPCTVRVVLTKASGGAPVLSKRIARPLARARATAGERALDLIRMEIQPGSYKASVEALYPVPEWEPFAARVFVGRAS